MLVCAPSWCPHTLLPSPCMQLGDQCWRENTHSSLVVHTLNALLCVQVLGGLQTENAGITFFLSIWSGVLHRYVQGLKRFFHQLFSHMISYYDLCCCLCLSCFLNLVIETIRDAVSYRTTQMVTHKTIFFESSFKILCLLKMSFMMC